MLESTATSAVFANEAKRFLTDPSVEANEVSSSVFQALQCGHLPNHFGLLPPHSEQTKTDFSLAISHNTV
jgi:hypothetical protein